MHHYSKAYDMQEISSLCVRETETRNSYILL